MTVQISVQVWSGVLPGRKVMTTRITDWTEPDIDCTGCPAPCCVFHLPVLSAEEAQSKQFQIHFAPVTDGFDGVEVPESAVFPTTKRNGNGGCVYLLNSRCKIHDQRPLGCRLYDCRTDMRREQLADFCRAIGIEPQWLQ